MKDVPVEMWSPTGRRGTCNPDSGAPGEWAVGSSGFRLSLPKAGLGCRKAALGRKPRRVQEAGLHHEAANQRQSWSLCPARRIQCQFH